MRMLIDINDKNDRQCGEDRGHDRRLARRAIPATKGDECLIARIEQHQQQPQPHPPPPQQQQQQQQQL